MNPQEAFLSLLIAAMTDAALELKLTQLQTTIDPDGKGARFVRLIIVPEAMEYARPDGKPFGSETPVRSEINKLHAEVMGTDYTKCSKCGGAMCHTRLKGYQCSRCN